MIWDRVRAALVEMEAWYGDNDSMSVYVGIDSAGRYFAGANIDADPWSDDPYGEGTQYQADGDSAEGVLEALIVRFASYRAEVDALRAEEANEAP